MYLIIQFQFIALKHTNKVYEESKVGHNILPSRFFPEIQRFWF